ncbi:TatD family hydrolase [Candidatus Nomurabacteria bacterium]|nr:TatD family hydrolase [Candidatus Nomurabacteria bacterium]
MKYTYIDIHSHLNLSPLYERREEIVVLLREKNVATITIGTDLATSQKAVDLAHEYPDVLFACVGLHPADNAEEIFDMDVYEALARDGKVVAIGECGLDYFRDQSEENKTRQNEIFLQHIALAQKVQKPLMIHARPSKGTMDAYEDVLTILESTEDYPRVNFHFFVGDIPIAKRILSIGGTMSFDGPITFSHDYDEVIAFLPIESIMAETDAPFAAPAPYRGKTCEPWMVEEIIARIAEIKQLPREDVVRILTANALRVFALTE